MNTSSDRKNDKNDKDNKRPKPSKTFDKKSHKKQGKMNPKDPFAKVTIYESDEGEVEVIEVSSSDEGVSYHDAAAIDSSDENVLLTALINKSILSGACFVTVMAKNQGKGVKSLKGSELKRHLTWKEQKMIISKLAFKGANLKKMEVFLTSVKIHLNGNSNYVETAASIVSKICKILSDVCFMENVDHGIMSEYFNRRVADLRNRRNYEAK